jgi:hypothetical protein
LTLSHSLQVCSERFTAEYAQAAPALRFVTRSSGLRLRGGLLFARCGVCCGDGNTFVAASTVVATAYHSTHMTACAGEKICLLLLLPRSSRAVAGGCSAWRQYTISLVRNGRAARHLYSGVAGKLNSQLGNELGGEPLIVT